MSVTVVATAGSALANAYQDASAVQDILDGVPNTTAWTALENDSDQQDLLAVHATTLLEVIAYLGQKTTLAQALAWPRQWVEDPDYGDQAGLNSGWQVSGTSGVYLDSTTIPRRMLRGHAFLCLELARAGNSDVWGTDTSLDVKRKKVGPLETEYVDTPLRRVGLRRYPAVWTAIYPLMRAARGQSVERA